MKSYLEDICGCRIARHFHWCVLLPFGRLTRAVSLLRGHRFDLTIKYTRLYQGGTLCFYCPDVRVIS